jgi:hypothetical protein
VEGFFARDSGDQALWERAQLAAGLAVLALTVSGCGSDDGLGKRYTISGTVTYKGQPLKWGKIAFIPQKADDLAGGGDVEDGQIQNVTTHTPGDGLLPGKYVVTVTAVEAVDVEKLTKRFKAAPDPVALAKAAAKGRALVPRKYASATSSDLTAEVSAEQRTFVFELKD